MSVFCVKCGTENKEDYNFCKNCGTQLLKLDDEPLVPVKEMDLEENEKVFGISKKRLNLFIGNNSKKIITRFEGMEKADSKVSFCVPAAVLGLFFGFFGLSFWFFYRKMNKQGWLFALLGTLFSTMILVFTYPYIENLFSQLTGIFNQSFLNDKNSQLFIEPIIEKISNMTFGVNFSAIFSDIEKALAGIIGALYSLYFYKKWTVRKIDEIASMYDETNDIEYHIKEKGGTSMSSVILAVLLMLGVYTILCTISAVILVFCI